MKWAASIKKGTFAGAYLGEAWLQLLLLKGRLFGLFLGVLRVTWQGTHLTQAHPHTPKKGTDLGWAALNTRELGNHRLGFRNRLGWMGTKVRFHGGLMRVKGTGLSLIVAFFQRPDTSVLIAMHIGHERLAGNPTDAGNLLVRQTLAFEVDNLHPLLYLWTWMMVAFVVQRGYLGVCKGDLDHRVPHIVMHYGQPDQYTPMQA